MENKPKLLWRGDVRALHSLSIINRELITQIHNHFDIYIEEYNFSYNQLIDDKSELLNTLLNKPKQEYYDIEVRCNFPLDTQIPKQADKLIIYQPWELNQLPIEWKEWLNKEATSICGLCKYNQDVFEEQLDIHSYFIQPIINDEFFKPYEKDEQDVTTFMYDGGTTWRKGFDIVLASFINLFAGNNNVKLIYKDSKVYNSNIWEHIKNANINCQYITKTLNYQELVDLYKQADYYLYPSRGEGFGYGAGQAMTMGIPTISTCHTGLDYINEKVAYPVGCQIVNFGDEDCLDIDKWIDKELKYTWSEAIQYPETNNKMFEMQILNAMTAKQPLQTKDYYRKYMYKFNKVVVGNQWIEYLNTVLENL